jgi:hypothetical protein
MCKINIGCGDMPTPGWINYDNSWTVRLARLPLLVSLLNCFGLLSPKQLQFINIVKQQGILYADAINSIPHSDKSVTVLYSCHMFEHLDRLEAKSFLREARRVLVHGGIIRIAVPNIRYHIDRYLVHGDSDRFIDDLYMARLRPTGILAKLRYLIIGERHHLWMYDGPSLCKILKQAGFVDPQVLPAGETTIPNTGLLDLAERSPESLFVEAVNP